MTEYPTLAVGDTWPGSISVELTQAFTSHSDRHGTNLLLLAHVQPPMINSW